ncbi:MAG: hypothetical protein HC849_16585 [Oscillatoriales cyanobacterium RU_3_3]|nr:hypothetical protein [Oscillatoriales cyanobacterium RU_3_3]NJR25382.1 hypothetical protein [Richelia sp. CSU_2_1]
MTGPPTPPPNPPPTPTPTVSRSGITSVDSSPPVSTRSGKLTRKLVMNVLEIVDRVFYGLMGKLGRTVYGSIQDAIALGILLKIPALIGQMIIGKDFSIFDICLQESPWGVSRFYLINARNSTYNA